VVDRLRSIKSWLLTAFALPAALQVLSSVDERLNFGPLLERAVLNFRDVSTAFWILISNFLAIDLRGAEGVLTFYIILVAVCFRAEFFSDISSFEFRYIVIESMSQSLIFVALISVGVENLWSFLILGLVYFLGFFLTTYYFSGDRIRPLRASVILVSILIIFTIFWYFLFSGNRGSGNSLRVILIGFLAASVSVVNNSVGVNRLFFSRVVVFSAGIFSIDYVHSKLIPAIDEFLAGAGA
jgi:hypothetical protein